MEDITTAQVIQLIQGLKPYLGKKEESADRVINALELISSPQAQEFIQNLSQLIPQKKKFKKRSQSASNEKQAEKNVPVESRPLVPATTTTSSIGNFGIIIFLVVIFLLWSDF